MKILGIKLTHDCSYSVVENNELKVLYELEKYNNNNRFKVLDSLEELDDLLKEEGYQFQDFDKIIIDGWVGTKESQVCLNYKESTLNLNVAPYSESEDFKDIKSRLKFKGFSFKEKIYNYYTYTHVTGHILSSYLTSEFAKKGEDSYVLIWDGGMFPRLYFIENKTNDIFPLGELFNFGVNIYSIFAQHFRPFKINANVIKDELSISGKVMAYVAYGEKREDILLDLMYIYKKKFKKGITIRDIPNFPYDFTKEFIQLTRDKDYLHEDIITTFHHFLGEMLQKKLAEKIKFHGVKSENLCYAGGAALNIKWNTFLREKLSLKLWIPPFPNDSGSSLGAVCSELFINERVKHLNWSVYSGPRIQKGNLTKYLEKEWSKRICSFKELAEILHYKESPILFLNSRSEIGPRSLGNRSILFSATNINYKNLINNIKMRENYRPVAPVCLEERSQEIFTPGCKDPYMLFEHYVKDLWLDKIPAAIHKDGSSRLQTINKQENNNLYNLILEYEKITGIPVLLNTSANFKGSGFFPNISSAMLWGKIPYIWSDGILYEKRVQEL